MGCLALVCSSALTAAVSDNAWELPHREAVALARAGDKAAAHERLHALAARFPGVAVIRMDHAVVSAWQGDDAHALEILRSDDPARLPDYVLKDYARSARNMRRWPLAEALYQELARRPSSRVEGVIGQVLVAADQRQLERGRQLLADLEASLSVADSQFADLKLACAYLAQRGSDMTGALACYNEGLRYHPDHRELRRQRALLADSIGAATLAEVEMQRAPDAFTPAEHARVATDVAALRQRWAAADPGEAAAVAAYYDELALSPADQPKALAFDRFVALVGAYRMDDAEAAWSDLVSEHGPADAIPAYVHAAAGRLNLYRNRPEDAVAHFRQALASGRGSGMEARFTWQMGLFNALADAERYDELDRLVQQLESQETPWIRPRADIWKANQRFEVAAEASAVASAYRDDHEDALERLDEMLSIAPANGSLRLSRAEVMRWRGWYRASASDVDMVAATGEYRLRTAVDAGQLALDIQAFGRAEDALSSARSLNPLDKGVLDLGERWYLHNQPELVVRASGGRSDGGRVGNSGYELDSLLYSAPIASNYRIFAHGSLRYADFDEGDGRDGRIGAGLEYRSVGLRLTAEVNRGIEQFRDTGARLGAEWWLTDRWYLEGVVAKHSASVPLRGLRIGISGDEARGTVGYRWHESRRAQATLGALDMDDDNERRWLAVDFEQRVWSRPRQKVTVNLGAYTSENTERGTVYFNPSRDRELTAGLVHDWRILRTHERSLDQRLSLVAGVYDQQGYGTDPLWRLQWEQSWQLTRALHLSYGASYGERPYDGTNERQTSYFFTLQAQL